MIEVLELLSPINFIDENIQENFLLRFNTKNPFQDRILNGEKIPLQPFFFFFLRYKIQRYRIPMTEVLELVVPFDRNRIVFGG